MVVTGPARHRMRRAPRSRALTAVAVAVAVTVGLGITGPALVGRNGARAPADLGVSLPPAPRDAPTTAPTGGTPTPAVPVRCRATTACVRWRLPPAADGAGSPALAAGHLVVPTAGGLVGFRTATGAREWRTDLAATAVSGPSVATVAGASRFVVVADQLGRLTAVDSSDGTLRWQQPVEGLGAVRAAQAVADGWLVAVRVRGADELTSFVAVLGVDAETGTIRWRGEDADAALSPTGAVMQDVNGTLTGLTAAGDDAWELVTDRPAATLSSVGELLLVGARDDALVVEVATGRVLDEIVGPPSQVRSDAGAVLWPVAGGIGYRSGDGVGWRADVPDVAGCCSGFVRDGTSVTVLTGRGEMIRLAADDGAVVERRRAPASFEADDGRAWLHGRIALATVPGPGGVARLHDALDGDHLADITSEAYALLASEQGTWVVLAPGHALTLDPAGRPGDAEGRPLGSALVR